MDNENQKEFFSIKEFADLIGVHPNTVRRSIRQGRLNAFRIGIGRVAVYRIARTELQRLSYDNLETLIKKIIADGS